MGTYAVTGGAGGDNTGGAGDGQAQGKVIFLQGHAATTTLAISDGNTQTIGDDDALAGNGALVKDGDGTLVIGGDRSQLQRRRHRRRRPPPGRRQHPQGNHHRRDRRHPRR